MTSELQTTEGGAARIDVEQWRAQRYVVLRRCLDVSAATAMERKLRALPSRRVSVGDRASSWLQRDIPSDHPLLRGDEWLSIEEQVADVVVGNGDVPHAPRAHWLNEYAPAEWAPLHVDGSGDAQLVAYLTGKSAVALALGSSTQVLEMNCGDALLFEASLIPHATLARNSMRVSMVARYFRTG